MRSYLPVLLIVVSASGCRMLTLPHDSPASSDAGRDAAAEGSGGSSGETDGGSLPKATQDYLNELLTYRTGGTIPASGIRGEVTVKVNSDGSHTVSIAGDKGSERLHVDFTSVGDFTLTADVNADGKIDEQETATTTGGVTTTVWQLDQNLSGAFNWRETTTSGLNLGSVSATVESIPLGEKTFVQTSSYSGTASMASWACDGLDPLAIGPGEACDVNGHHTVHPHPTFCEPPPPTSDGGTDAGTGTRKACFFGGANPDENGSPTWKSTDLGPDKALTQGQFPPGQKWRPYYIITKGPMRCDPGLAGIISQTLENAGPDFDARVVNAVNPSWSEVDDHIANSGGIYYGCALPSCVDAQAVTARAGFSDNPNAYVTALNSDVVKQGPEVLEEIITHEWFHLYQQHSPMPDGGDERDFIYSCSRVANAGRGWDHHYYSGICCDASSARDFAMCADYPHKAKYGLTMIFLETADGYVEVPNGSLTSYTDKPLPKGMCIAPPSTDKADCGCALERVPAYCDQTLLTQSDALKLGLIEGGETLSGAPCCERCPAGVPDTAAFCGMLAPGTEQYCAGGACPMPLPGGTYPTGPTPTWRQFLGAFKAGQADNAGPPGVTSDACQPQPGYSY